ncbi:hypothetical protein [Rhizobium sp. SSA_523]|uniref:hypothetical protein n=1 Tax=Rhizobium sp. SSA_523 TaxID=2952477 RepID=UPI0020918423|nr:hypothetical protein [Rhizobium sp. SSA_523]MCO5733871.1 hypothetical protein [Rhizobium sp. SSA_523]WKC24862.1 hypothetical protein QTJ18_12660 [Rhizobium sp. SSA_523]
MRITIRRWEILLRLLCAAVFLSLGLAHHAPPLAAAITQDADYALPDGSFATLCTQAGEDDRPLKGVLCEVCLLCASAMLPAPATQASLACHASSLLNALPEIAAVIGGSSIPAPRCRAPPVAA